ncbi:MAG: 30S ribosomal protein S8 [uncultured bacterium]|nr:MAG: 30S ribosomal protein S8 [uncultured bacterium]HCU70232.1 30S ribosomal protein S8 [Candidatus Moranbacteria bacterium]
MLDPIAEMLTRIRNAQTAGHSDVVFAASKLKMAISNILEKEGFVESVSKEKQESFENIRIALKYYKLSNTKKLPAIKGLRRISKQGQRIYVKNKEIRSVKNNFGISIISTPKGVMTGFEARKLGLGGEVICEIW